MLVLVHATRKLPHYFQAYTIYVLIEYPLQSLLKRSNFTRRIAKWGTQLGSFDIRHRGRSWVKGQILVDFVAEFSPRGGGGDEMVCSVKGVKLEHSFRLGFKAYNNEVEY